MRCDWLICDVTQDVTNKQTSHLVLIRVIVGSGDIHDEGIISAYWGITGVNCGIIGVHLQFFLWLNNVPAEAMNERKRTH